MEEKDLPGWVIRLRDNYESNPTRWMWAGGTLLVVLLIAALVVPRLYAQKAEASALLSEGMQALSTENYVNALQTFTKIEEGYPLSGFRDEALLYKSAALFGLERYDAAEASFRRYASENPTSELAPEALMGAAACLEARGDSRAALIAYRDARAKYAASFLVKAMDLQIARLAEKLGETAVAAQIYETLESDSEGLWRELARGHRRLIVAPTGGVARSDTTSS